MCVGTGTGFVVRRQAMAQIHWFPTLNPEDVMTSIYLTAAGWKISYVPEIVQWGLVPDTVRKHVRQRTRWAAGYVYIISALWGKRIKGHATLQQRMRATTVSILVVLTNIIIGFSVVAVPWILQSGSPTVVYQSLEEFRRLLLLENLSFFAAFFAGLARSRAACGKGVIFLTTGQVGLVPFQIITIVKTAFSEIFGSKAESFAPDATFRTSRIPLGGQPVVQIFDVDLLSHTIILSLQLLTGYIGRHAVSAGSGTALLLEILSKGGYPAVFLLWVNFIVQTASRIPRLLNNQPLCSSPGSLLTPVGETGVLCPSVRAIDASRTRPDQTYAYLAALYHGVVLILLWL